MRLLVAIWLSVLATHAVAGQVADAISPKPYQEMKFSVFTPCSGSASFCWPTVLAKGIITMDSAPALERFIKRARALPEGSSGWVAGYVRVCFDSPGGNLKGGVRLGKTVRRLRLDTCLAPAYGEADNPKHDAFQDEMAVCASACVLAFSGGMLRTVEGGSRMGVHQFYSENGQLGDGATQFTVVQLADYLESVGVSRRMLDLASIVPADKIYWLDARQMQSVKLDNTARSLNRWQLQPTADGKIYAFLSQPVTQSDDSNITQFLLMETTDGLEIFIRGNSTTGLRKALRKRSKS